GGPGHNPPDAVIGRRANTLLGAELAEGPKYRELQPYARQQAIDLVANALPAERSNTLVEFRQTVQTLEATYRRAAQDASRDEKGATNAADGA
ncbi:type III secretion protein BopE, partial [Burkholderia pseudomallei]